MGNQAGLGVTDFVWLNPGRWFPSVVSLFQHSVGSLRVSFGLIFGTKSVVSYFPSFLKENSFDPVLTQRKLGKYDFSLKVLAMAQLHGERRKKTKKV